MHPGALLGLPPGVPNPLYDAGYWRDLLALLGVMAAAFEAAGKRRSALLLAVIFAVLGIAFWIFAFGRPYGVLVDVATTRWAADLSIAGSAGGEDGFVIGEPSTASRPWATLSRQVPTEVLILVPTMLPLAVVPAVGAALAWLWGRREAATLAAILWLGAHTGALETLRGLGFLPGLWARPGPSLLWAVTTAAVLGVGRLPIPRKVASGIGAALIVVWVMLGRRLPEVGVAEAMLALTFDSLPWLILAAIGLRRKPDAATLAFVIGGATLALVRATGGPGDAWAGAAFYRVGLLLGAAVAVGEWSETVALRVYPRPDEDSARPSWVRRLPSAIVVLVALTGSYTAWWDPIRTDEVAKASAGPVPEAVLDAMAWLRANTAESDVVLAHSDYAATVAVLGGRRVLRAPGLLVTEDEERRLRLERAVLTGRAAGDLRRRYSLRYVFLAPGQFREYGLDDPDEMATRGNFRRVYANAKGMRVYEVRDGEIPEVTFK